MSRLIDADARVTVQSFDVKHKEYIYIKMSVQEALDFATDEGCPPVIDAESVRHGRWIKKEIFRCSECDMPSMRRWPYCEMCGAKMDGDENEVD